MAKAKNILTRATLVNILLRCLVKVTFIKKDGSEREMLCTLMEDHIPEDKKPKGTTTKKPNESVLAVFDKEKEEWRSFQLASLKKVEVVFDTVE